MQNNCPVCGEKAIMSCKCPRHDSVCTNKHKWHTCTIHDVKVLGSSNHSTDTMTCTCLNKNKRPLDIKTRILNALEDWVHTYASEMCSDEAVAKSMKRIQDNGGTLTYIADLRNAVKKQLK